MIRTSVVSSEMLGVSSLNHDDAFIMWTDRS